MSTLLIFNDKTIIMNYDFIIKKKLNIIMDYANMA